MHPKVVLVFSGKRKSGKDFTAERLKYILEAKKLAGACALIRLSEPLKEKYAKDHGLSFEALLTDSPYKEDYRRDMVKWGESERVKDPNVFCNLAINNRTEPIWIITDARRPTDIQFFQQNFSEKSLCLLVRIQATSTAREKRGWKFMSGVDDAESECALDSGVAWNIVIDNNGTVQELEQLLITSLVCRIEAALGLGIKAAC